MFISRAPKGILPIIAPLYYLVETLKALRRNTETDAKDFINLHRKFCKFLRADNTHKVRRVYSQLTALGCVNEKHFAGCRLRSTGPLRRP